MTVGLSTTNLANKWLDLLRNQSFTAVAATYVDIHTGDPGASGASNLAGSASATRPAVTFSAASSGALALTGTQPSWVCDTAETITHISVWDANTAGNFLWSAQLTVEKTVANNDTLTLTTCGLGLTPLAA